MSNEITVGISVKLNELFGEGYEIYTDDVEQGLKEPCFFIKLLKVQNKPLLGKRKNRTYPYIITYFPIGGNKEMEEISEKMMDGLEYINLSSGDIVRGHSIESEIVDGNLQTSVQYDVFLNSAETTETMDNMLSDINLEGV
ncbi:MAG: hypothetical protein E7284_10220 [Lachnospiraceae bacterium]|nr:hypothetical protein [Lachnospiraceae bacterium]